MTRSLRIVMFVFVCFTTYGQPLTGTETVMRYSIAQKKLLVRSTERFINLITQDNLDRDSVTIMAGRLTGIPFLTAHSATYENESFSAGTALVNAGKIQEATQLLKDLKGDDKLQLTIDLATWFVYKEGVSKSDLDNADRYIRAALLLSSEVKNRNSQYKCLHLLGEYYRQSGNEAESKKIYLNLISSGRQEANKKVMAGAWHQLGKLHAKADSMDITYLKNALTIYDELQLKEKKIELLWDIFSYHMGSDIRLCNNDLDVILQTQQLIGYRHSLFAEYFFAYVLARQIKYLDALKHAKNAFDNMQWSGISAIQGTFYMRLGVLHGFLGKDNDALAYYKKGLENRSRETHVFWFKSLLFATSLLWDMHRPDEALSLMKKVTTEFPPITPWEKAQVFSITGACYETLDNYKMANENFISFLEVTNANPVLDRFGELLDSYLEIANFYITKQNIRTALLFMDKLKAVDEGRTDSTFSYRKSHTLYRIDSISGNYKSALSNYIVYKLYEDSFKNRAQQKAFEELTIKYGAEKKDKDIKLLQKDKQLQATMLLQSKNTRNWILGAVALLLTIIGLLVYNTRLKQRTNKKLEHQRLEIEKQNSRLLNLVDEKDWLVKEIHHRVKNNLQIVMSLLNSQSAFIENDAALTAIHDSQHRVQAMSLIHQKLYNTENVSSIDMSLYIQELVAYLTKSFDTGQRIRFDLNIEPLEMDVSQAVPLGLILNEAITNSIKYAFPDDRNGVISISLSAADHDHYLLIISDNGIGMPPATYTKKPGSLGLSLMMGLSEDINGNFSIKNDNGTTIQISFLNEQDHVGHDVLSTSSSANS